MHVIRAFSAAHVCRASCAALAMLKPRRHIGCVFLRVAFLGLFRRETKMKTSTLGSPRSPRTKNHAHPGFWTNHCVQVCLAGPENGTLWFYLLLLSMAVSGTSEQALARGRETSGFSMFAPPKNKLVCSEGKSRLKLANNHMTHNLLQGRQRPVPLLTLFLPA